MMSSENPRRQLYTHFAALARALGHEHRLELLDQLSQGEWPVEELAVRVGLSTANASQHLHQLRRAGLVQSRKAGKNVFFRLADGPVLEAVHTIQAIAERNIAEVRSIVADYFAGTDKLAPVSMSELQSRLDDGDILLIDVRDEAEYRQGHLPGALHLPMDEIEAHLRNLPADREIVAYCRGRYCVLSYHTVELLRAHGIRSRRLDGGYAEWRAGGGAAEIGSPNRASNGAASPPQP